MNILALVSTLNELDLLILTKIKFNLIPYKVILELTNLITSCRNSALHYYTSNQVNICRLALIVVN